MRAILSKKHYIQLIILETYLANGQVTVQQLEETTQATKQTILKQLNELENRGFFQVEKKKDHLLLRKNKPISYSEVYSYIYQDSVQIQFISLVFSCPFITTSEILKKLKISKSQFRRIKKQVADFFELP
ncbi:MarR family transcriptional regulator [Enterococcus hirae]|nr:MarR family transcriptional regulator [Enterococcus hirae]